MALHITLRQLQIFEQVAQLRSYTRAAEQLYLSQPAVSMQVKQLEQQLGLPLIEVLGKQLYLTEAGQELLFYARQLRQQMEELETVVDNLKGGSEGRLRLSVATTANYFAPLLLSYFYQRFPAVTVTLDITNRQSLLAQLDCNEVDLVIMGQPPADRVDVLEFQPFMENPLVIIAAPNHPLAGRGDIQLSELSEQIFLLREKGSGTRGALERFFQQQQLTLRAGMEVSSDEAIKQSVQAGLGLAFLSFDAIQTELALGRLAVLPIQGLPLIRHWYIVHRHGKRLSRFAEAFKRFLLEEGSILLGKGGVSVPK